MPMHPGKSGRRKKKLVAQHGDRCYICGIETVRYQWGVSPRDQPNAQTCDHLIPTSKGGTDDLDNLRIACVACNRAKGDIPCLDPVGEVRLLAHIFRVQQGVYA